jgi:hypothetical protein
MVTELAERKRLIGVTVLAILNAIIGIADLTNIASILGVNSLVSMIGGTLFDLTAVAQIIEGVLVLQGIVLFILAYGFLNGKSWGWALGLIFGVWDIIIGLILLAPGIIRIIYGSIVIYYLMRPHVKAYFGKT